MISARKKASKMRADITEESKEDEENAVEDESTHKEEQPRAYGFTTPQRKVTEVRGTKPPAKVTEAKPPAKATEAKPPAKATEAKPPAKVTEAKPPAKATDTAVSSIIDNCATNSFKKLRSGKEVML
jgi:hypothetical protein